MVLALASCLLPLCITPGHKTPNNWSMKKSRDFTPWLSVLATPEAFKWVRHSQNTLLSESGLHSERLFVGTATRVVVMITRAQHIYIGSDCCSSNNVKYTNNYIILKNGILKSISSIFPWSEGYITQYTP